MQLFFDGKGSARLGVPSSRQGASDAGLAQRPPPRCAQIHRSEGSSKRDIRDRVEHGSCTACGHRQLPEAVRNQYQASSRGGPPRHSNVLNSIDRRRRAVTCLCTELFLFVGNESPPSRDTRRRSSWSSATKSRTSLLSLGFCFRDWTSWWLAPRKKRNKYSRKRLLRAAARHSRSIFTRTA
jgi:hypothetical protein